jgi:hypothetical protein
MCFSPDSKTLATGHADSTILVWDLTPEIDRRETSVPPPDPGRLKALWTTLADSDGRKAHAAIWDFITLRQGAVSFLSERLSPAKPVAPERLKQWLADLDNDEYERRETASRELGKLEEQAEPALRQALKTNLSEERRRRVEDLLSASFLVRSPEKLRSLRAVEVLEKIETPEACGVIKGLATGAPEARLTQEAKASLERLASRSFK